jgi:hypothetical protein
MQLSWDSKLSTNFLKSKLQLSWISCKEEYNKLKVRTTHSIILLADSDISKFVTRIMEQREYNIARFNMNEMKTHIELWNKCKPNVISIYRREYLLICDNIEVYHLSPSPCKWKEAVPSFLSIYKLWNHSGFVSDCSCPRLNACKSNLAPLVQISGGARGLPWYSCEYQIFLQNKAKQLWFW